MIDTTGWKIKVTPEQFKKIRKVSKEFTEYDHQNEHTNFRIIKNNIYVPSSDSNISLRCNDDGEAYIEFSVPKQYYGNNVILLYPSQLEQALMGVHTSLVELIGDFPPYMQWKLHRLDLCYSWRLASQNEAAATLEILKTFDYPRKGKYLYKESVMWRGRTSSVKFYLKHPEYVYNERKKNPQVYTYSDPLEDKMYMLSKGVLRFEITFRRQGIQYLFAKKHISYRDLLNKDFLEKALSRTLVKLTMNLDKSVMADREALKLLKKYYPYRKAVRLFIIYKLYTSPQINNRMMLLKNYNQSTIWRNKNDLAVAKVGLPSNAKPIPIRLEIPSDFVVNKDSSSGLAERLRRIQ